MNSILKSILLLFVVILVGITSKAQTQQQERNTCSGTKNIRQSVPVNWRKWCKWGFLHR